MFSNSNSLWTLFSFQSRRIWIVLVAWLYLIQASPTFAFAQEVAEQGARGSSPTSFLAWLVHVSGIIGLFILILSVIMVSIIVKSFLELRISEAIPPDVQETVQTMIEERNYRDLQTLLTQENSYYSDVLAAGVVELRHGLDEARNRMDLHSETLTSKMERGIANLAVLGTLGPMIGLLGTLKGMISSFSVIAMSGVSLDAAKVADGISEALVLTFEGVALSIPATFFYSLFKNRIQRIRAEGMEIADMQLKEIAVGLKRASKEAASDSNRTMG